MAQFFNLAFIAIGAFYLVIMLIALFVQLPKGQLTAPQVKTAYNATATYRAGGFKKFLYFFIPVSVLILFSTIGGLMWLIAVILGVKFSKRYAIQAMPVQTIEPAFEG